MSRLLFYRALSLSVHTRQQNGRLQSFMQWGGDPIWVLRERVNHGRINYKYRLQSVMSKRLKENQTNNTVLKTVVN